MPSSLMQPNPNAFQIPTYSLGCSQNKPFERLADLERGENVTSILLDEQKLIEFESAPYHCSVRPSSQPPTERC